MILVPIIFNNASENALKYAIEVSKIFDNLDIVCFHATESESTNQEELSEKAKDMDSLINSLKGDGEMNFHKKIIAGDYEEQIMKFASKNLIDVIIVGTRKVDGFEKVMHTGRTAKFLNNTNLPTWVIPEDYSYKSINNIMWASDFSPMKNDDALDPIVAIAKVFDAEVRIAHVHTKSDKLNLIEENEMNRQGFLFENGVKHSFKKIKRSTVSKGISHYLKIKGDNDLLVMVKRSHGFMDRVFKRDNSIEFSVNPEIPIMILHEEAAKGALKRHYKNL